MHTIHFEIHDSKIQKKELPNLYIMKYEITKSQQEKEDAYRKAYKN